jgi:RHS repeat-associated protein
VLLDFAGAVAQLYAFDAYGNAIGFNPATALTEFLYSGEQFDSKIGQQYLRQRYYDPSTGRFNRLDPFFGNVNDPQSLHKYLYTHADPVNGIDPSGNSMIGAAISIAINVGRVAAIGAVIGVGVNTIRNIATGDQWNANIRNAALWGAALYPAILMMPIVGVSLAVLGLYDSFGVAYSAWTDRQSTWTRRSAAALYVGLNVMFAWQQGKRIYHTMRPILQNGDMYTSIIFRPDMVEAAVWDHQGYKTVLYGQAKSSSTTPGHENAMMNKANEMGRSGKYLYVLLQRSWRTALDYTYNNPLFRKIPDIIGIRKDGRIEAYEVKSNTDNVDMLRTRLEQSMKELPDEMQGDYDVLPPQP